MLIPDNTKSNFYSRMLLPQSQRTELAEQMLLTADVEPTLRPTELSISHFRNLADAYSKLCEEDAGLFSYEFRDELRQKKKQRRPSCTIEEEAERDRH
ncbi:dimethyladenosine transferase 1, mitochondrial [Acipenser oxyrinchus oxyrinchus]|uniref:Dimethyladenosine transferase 1, mitochondrial n=1 Tax=Acipenser oxyrinchus oxyrinchus TaxID=40147 RepID=A0AAD8G9B6_ACIOX|nr:dimethyladenosine transferase 1, mitochondrial [Acipenser oxyrinchus oxyrinchus]